MPLRFGDVDALASLTIPGILWVTSPDQEANMKITRMREITRMMGYESIDATLEAIGGGELALLKMDTEDRQAVSAWLWRQASAVRDEKPDLATALEDLASTL